MLLSDQDPTQTCPVSLVLGPVEPPKKPLPRDDGDPFAVLGTASPNSGTLVVGHYQLITQLGKGSTGVVWKALDLGHGRREVALKILHADYQDDHARIRFANEVRALAALDDPHIAKVWESGQTKDGRPYLAMELVTGSPLLKYCDTWCLGIAERLELVVRICQGIQHAHHRGILHRDLKPANILVTLHDGQPMPKIIDFGLAKSLHGPLAPSAVETTQRGCLIGTIGYMSPEQAELDQRDVDTRSDVYSICAILYELLTGTLPIPREELHRHSLTEALRLVREVEPDLASSRVAVEPNLTVHAARCKVPPVLLPQQLKGDLDAILMKGLSKDRHQRYQSSSELAEDIKRYLEGGVVLARKRTYGYVAQKWFRKHWKAAAILFILLSSFLTSWGMTIAGYFRVLEEKVRVEEAQVDRDRALQREKERHLDMLVAFEFLEGALRIPTPTGSGSKVTLLEALDSAVRLLDKQLQGRPRADSFVRVSLAKTYIRLFQVEKAAQLLEPVLDRKFDSPEDQARFVLPAHAVAIEALVFQGKYQEAESACRHVLSHFVAPDDVTETHRAKISLQLAKVLAETRRYDEADALMREHVHATIQKYHDVNDANGHVWGARLSHLGLLLERSASNPTLTNEALELLQQYSSIAMEAKDFDLLLFRLQLMRVSLLVSAKRYQEALGIIGDLSTSIRENPRIRMSFGTASIQLKINEAIILQWDGKLAEAEQLLTGTLQEMTDRFGEQSDHTQLALRSLLDVKLTRQKYWQALELFPRLTGPTEPTDSVSPQTPAAKPLSSREILTRALVQFSLWNLR